MHWMMLQKLQIRNMLTSSRCQYLTKYVKGMVGLLIEAFLYLLKDSGKI